MAEYQAISLLAQLSSTRLACMHAPSQRQTPIQAPPPLDLQLTPHMAAKVRHTCRPSLDGLDAQCRMLYSSDAVCLCHDDSGPVQSRSRQAQTDDDARQEKMGLERPRIVNAHTEGSLSRAFQTTCQRAAASAANDKQTRERERERERERRAKKNQRLSVQGALSAHTGFVDQTFWLRNGV
ncbi:hypothetical protein ACJBU6_06199 [Exserohilum turcicum]